MVAMVVVARERESAPFRDVVYRTHEQRVREEAVEEARLEGVGHAEAVDRARYAHGPRQDTGVPFLAHILGEVVGAQGKAHLPALQGACIFDWHKCPRWFVSFTPYHYVR